MIDDSLRSPFPAKWLSKFRNGWCGFRSMVGLLGSRIEWRYFRFDQIQDGGRQICEYTLSLAKRFKTPDSSTEILSIQQVLLGAVMLEVSSGSCKINPEKILR